MPDRSTESARFIRAVHRRLIIVRSLESFGVCLLAACAVMTPALAILWWRDSSTSPISLFAVVAVAWTITSAAIALRIWPTVMTAATEADRQLDLAELLATALLLDRRRQSPANDLLATEVLAMADARCRQLSPTSVVLHRLGVRAWGGIGLSAALVLTLALLPMQPRRSDASANPDDALASTPLTAIRPTAMDAGTTIARAPYTPPHADLMSDDAARFGTHSTDEPAHRAAVSSRDNLRAAETAAAGTGHGSAQTKLNVLPLNLPTGGAAPNAANGQTTAGSGAPAASPADGRSTSGSSSGQSASRTVAPWSPSQSHPLPESPNAPAPDAIPTEYRDMVQAYFDRK